VVIHLDTTFLVDAIRESRRGTDGPARRWLADHPGESMAMSLFVACELQVGAELHADPEAERRRIRQLCGGLPVVIPDERLADTYARIHGGLARSRALLATMDLLIAATALTHGASLLTANEAHFARVPGLRVLGYR
jgi:predicted nucleic acid-binding protein